MEERGWGLGPVKRAGWDAEFAGDASGVPIRVFSSTHLAVPDSGSERPCNSAFLRVDVGRTDEPPRRWAVWSLPRNGRPDDNFVVQVSAAERGATIAGAWACRPGDDPERHPARLLVEHADALLQGLRTPERTPALIGMDPIWAAREWAERWSPLGRDHAHLGLGVLATSILAWPIWKVMEAPDAAVAWLASIGFTGLGLLVASRIHRAVSLPSRRASELWSRLKATGAFEDVLEPRVAEAMPLPVAATLRAQRVLDQASIASTLVVARRHRRSGIDLRLALRTVSWPQATVLHGRILPKAWLSLEMKGAGAGEGSAQAGILAGGERGEGTTRAVLNGDELDRWDARI